MRQVDKNGDIVFDSKEFGSGSVNKTSQIAEILRELLSNIVLTTKSEDTELILADYYKKSEVDKLLGEYAKLSEIESQISELVDRIVGEQLDEYNFSQMEEDIQALSKTVGDYSSTIKKIEDNQVQVQSQVTNFNTTIEDFRTNLNNLSNLVSSYSSAIESNKSSLESLQNTLDKLNLIEIAEFSSDISAIKADIEALRTRLTNIESALGDTSILCKYDRAGISAQIIDLTSEINGIPSAAITNANREQALNYLSDAYDLLGESNDLSNKSTITSKITSTKNIVSSLSLNAAFSEAERTRVVEKFDVVIQNINNAETFSDIDSSNIVAYLISLLSMIVANKDNIGILSALTTTAKDNLVIAINEHQTKLGNLESLKTTAKGDLVVAINELFQSASEGKSLIATAITGKGVDAVAEETFQSLANKITSIPTGTDTSDADATASDITSGKTAYVKGQKLVGTHTCSGGSSSRDLNSRVTFFDSADHWTPANTSETIAEGAGIFICTYMNAICSSGDDLCYGTVNYLIDGVAHDTSEYLEGEKIQFKSSLVLQVGELIYYESGTTTCNYCGSDGSPVVQWGGVLVLE